MSMTQIISNKTNVKKLQSDWDGVDKLFQRMRYVTMVSFLGGLGISGAGMVVGKVVFNLPVLLAFDVLKNVVQSVRDEGRFFWPNNKLWEGAQAVLPWNNWDELKAGVDRRNKIAHDGEIFERSICCKDIENVQEQLVSWGIIDPAKRIENLS